MKTMFYVSSYCYDKNKYVRCAISASTKEAATQEVLEWLGSGWKVSTISALCPTDVDFFEEL